MSLRLVQEPPKAEDFTPLQEHQEQTPSTFYGAKPVLYAQQSDLTLSVTVAELRGDATFSRFHVDVEGDDSAGLIKNVGAWVNSEFVQTSIAMVICSQRYSTLILFQSSPSPIGVAIPYPSIALHATMKSPTGVEALLLNLSLNDAETVNSDADINVLELTMYPPGWNTSSPQESCIQSIYLAMNTCADLHPDPDENGEVDVDETAPGATGWITADNMDDFVDEDGNFRGRELEVEDEALGPGAGYVRLRDEESEDVEEVNGDGHEEKYQRTG